MARVSMEPAVAFSGRIRVISKSNDRVVYGVTLPSWVVEELGGDLQGKSAYFAVSLPGAPVQLSIGPDVAKSQLMGAVLHAVTSALADIQWVLAEELDPASYRQVVDAVYERFSLLQDEIKEVFTDGVEARASIQKPGAAEGR